MIKSTSDVIKSRYNYTYILAIWFNLRQERILKIMHLSFQRLFDTPKPSWRWLDSHNYKGNRSPVPPLSHGDRNVIENVSKAEAFNAYFSSMFIDDDGSDISTLQKSLIFHSSVIQTVKFKERGPDLLPSHLLKLGAEFIALASLTHIFQLAISCGKLPLDWVSANIVAICPQER